MKERADLGFDYVAPISRLLNQLIKSCVWSGLSKMCGQKP